MSLKAIVCGVTTVRNCAELRRIARRRAPVGRPRPELGAAADRRADDVHRHRLGEAGGCATASAVAARRSAAHRLAAGERVLLGHQARVTGSVDPAPPRSAWASGTKAVATRSSCGRSGSAAAAPRAARSAPPGAVAAPAPRARCVGGARTGAARTGAASAGGAAASSPSECCPTGSSATPGSGAARARAAGARWNRLDRSREHAGSRQRADCAAAARRTTAAPRRRRAPRRGRGGSGPLLARRRRQLVEIVPIDEVAIRSRRRRELAPRRAALPFPDEHALVLAQRRRSLCLALVRRAAASAAAPCSVCARRPNLTAALLARPGVARAEGRTRRTCARGQGPEGGAVLARQLVGRRRTRRAARWTRPRAAGLGLRTTSSPLFQFEKLLKAAANEILDDRFEDWIAASEATVGGGEGERAFTSISASTTRRQGPGRQVPRARARRAELPRRAQNDRRAHPGAPPPAAARRRATPPPRRRARRAARARAPPHQVQFLFPAWLPAQAGITSETEKTRGPSSAASRRRRVGRLHYNHPRRCTRRGPRAVLTALRWCARRPRLLSDRRALPNGF